MIGDLLAVCDRAANGHERKDATTPQPSNVMNSRRCMSSPKLRETVS